MNKIYSVIWSKTRSCYVVVSEFAKCSGKCSSNLSKKIIAAFLAAGTVLSVTGNAWAAIPEGTATGDDSVAIGTESVSKGVNSVAVGKGAKTGEDTDKPTGSHAIAVGPFASTGGMYSSVLGAFTGVTVNPAITADIGSKKGRVLQGFGATVLGSLNSSSTSKSGQMYASVANSIVGVANISTDSNGALIYGAGNEIKNSYQDVIFDGNEEEIQGLVDSYDVAVNNGDRTKMAEVAATLRGMVKVSGGQVMAFGGQNTADSAYRSQIIGVGNELKGAADGEITIGEFTYKKYDTEYDLLDGFENKVGNSSHVSVIGTGNSVQNKSDNNVIFGDYHGLNGGGNNVIIGSYTPTVDNESSIGFKATQHTANIEDTVMLGHNADVTKSQGVALGAYSLANTGDSVPGFDPSTGTASTRASAAWKSTAAAVSVGNESRKTWYGFSESVLQKGITNNKDALEALGIDTSLAPEVLLESLNDKQMAFILDKVTHETEISDNKPEKDGTVYVAQPGGGTTRQITNVAAGLNDTDAVNVAQLKASQTHYYSVNDGDATLGNYNNDGAVGKYTLAAGVNAESQGLLSTVVGANSKTVDPLAESLVKIKKNSAAATNSTNTNIRLMMSQINPVLQTMPSVTSAGSTVIGSLNAVNINEQSVTYANTVASRLAGTSGKQIALALVDFLENAKVFDGVSNTVAGTMNETTDTNVALIYGTGNTITNSYENFEAGFDVIKTLDLKSIRNNLNGSSWQQITALSQLAPAFNALRNMPNAAALQTAIENNDFDAMKRILSNYISNDGGKGGRSIAIGTNNKIDYGTMSRLTGTNNTLTGTEDFPASYTILDGYGNKAYSTSKVTVLGNNNTVGAKGTFTKNTIVLGDNNTITAGSNNNIVIGTVTNAVGAEDKGNIVSIGKNATVTGENSIAIGQGHTVTGANSGAFGDPTIINSDSSYSVGNNNTIGEGFENVFVLGNSITTVASNSVFLGDSAAYIEAGESTGGLGDVTNATVNGLTFGDFAGPTPVGVVSVGSVGNERRIQNVAAGLVSATSTDAINGSQLYAAIDGMQFNIVGGDNVEVIKNTDENGHAVYTIHSLNAMVQAGPSENVTVTDEVGNGKTNGVTTDMTSEGTGTTSGDAGTTGGTAGTMPDPTPSEDPIGPLAPGEEKPNEHTTIYTVDAKDTYVKKGEVTQAATDDSDKVVTTFTHNYGTTFDVDSNNTYVSKAEVTQEAADDSADVKVKLTRNDGKSFDLDLKDRYVSKAEVTQQATDTSDDVTVELSRNDGKSFELATKNTYLAKAELKDHTLTLGRNDGTEFVVNDIATLNDGMSYAGDTGEATVKLNQTVTVTGGATELTDGNIGVVASQDGDNAKLEIKLAKEIKDVDSMAVNKTITVGGNTTIDGDKITTSTVNADILKAGDTTINNEGMTINNGPSVTKDGINAGGKKITNVAPGTSDNDAATVGQLNNGINRLDDRTRKGLAGAAALAALHPMDFNPDDKLQFSAGVGNYRGETAAALGAFYRPDESVMFSIGGTFGNADNMVNAGITFGLDGTRNRITRSRTAMAHEIVELREHIAKQDEQIAQLTNLVNKLVAPEQRLENPAMFPDVPENHWAYQYVEDLQKRGIIEGYPDGKFAGSQSMTRYEFAAMLDRALIKGVKLDAAITREFESELSRIYVERISGEDNDRHKIERVRVNNSDSKYPEGKNRDVYGSKIQPVVSEKAAGQ